MARGFFFGLSAPVSGRRVGVDAKRAIGCLTRGADKNRTSLLSNDFVPVPITSSRWSVAPTVQCSGPFRHRQWCEWRMQPVVHLNQSPEHSTAQVASRNARHFFRKHIKVSERTLRSWWLKAGIFHLGLRGQSATFEEPKRRVHESPSAQDSQPKQRLACALSSHTHRWCKTHFIA